MKINIKGPGNPLLGYGHASLNIVTTLDKLCDVTYFPIGQPQPSTQEHANIIQKCMDKRKNFDHNKKLIRKDNR